MALYFVLAVVIVSLVLLRSYRQRIIRAVRLEAELNAAGFYLRDDRSIREGVECFKGHEEAYSLHRRNPFERFIVIAMPRHKAVEYAYAYVFDANGKQKSTNWDDEDWDKARLDHARRNQ